MQRLWKISSYFKQPLESPFIQSLTNYNLSLYEWLIALDNPRFREKIQNTYHDPDYDEYFNGGYLEDNPFDLSDTSNVDDWEEVE